MLGDAFTAAISGLAIGLLIAVAALVFILGPLVYLEIRYGGEGDEGLEDQGPEEGVWNFPPKWSPPRAESDLGDSADRWAA